MQILYRPQTLKEFIGQEKLKNILRIIIKSSKARKTSMDHILLYGQPGVGKTSLAAIIANELGAKIRFAQGPLLDKKANILSLFGSISKNEVIFIDEIHGINNLIEEMIYSALEDGVMDIIIGPEGESKIIRMKLPPFTLIGATTKLSRISKPLKDRFGIMAKLSNYSNEDIAKIILNFANKLEWKIIKRAATIIAMHSNETPRIGINIFKRCIDFAIDLNINIINMLVVQKTLKLLCIFKKGLNEQHVNYLRVLNEKFLQKAASLESIAGVLNDNRENIEVDIEPILIKNNFISKSSNGRKITIEGIKYLTSYNLTKVKI